MSGSNRPNILWYCTDQQRHDTIAALGQPAIRTPVLDRFAEEGAAFTRAYTQSPICTPSRASFLTGRYPASHHVHRNGNDFFPPGETLVTRILADAGYDCGLAGKFHLSRAGRRIERRPDDGYRVFHWSHHPYPDWGEGHAYEEWLRREKGVDPKALYAPLTEAYGPGVPEELHQTTWCTEMALRFIAERREAPWLMSLNPFDPHPPCDPPQEYLDRYNPQAMPWPLFREEDIERQKAFRAIDQQTAEAVNPMLFDESKAAYGADLDSQDKASNPPASYDARKLKAAYYAQIELIDTQFGRILDALKASGQWENTIVIFTSDHGEMLGDHGLLYKGCRFFEGLTHVPLIVSWPGRFRAGLRSEALVELVDLAPTLLEAAGLPAPPTMQGKSLLPILEGRADPGFHKPHVVSEYNDALGMAQGRAPGSKSDHSHGSMVFDGRYKTCVYHGHGVGEIYDLQTDPGEFRNLWFEPEHRELKSELLLRHLDAMMATSDAGIPRTAHF